MSAPTDRTSFSPVFLPLLSNTSCITAIAVPSSSAFLPSAMYRSSCAISAADLSRYPSSLSRELRDALTCVL